MKKYLFIFLASFYSFQFSAQEINLEAFVTGFSRPLDILNAGDDRLFIVERAGQVKIIDGQGDVLTEPFLDIRELVYGTNSQDERGLLGMAFHPDYESNGYFYLNYSDNESNSNIVRYSVSNNTNIADPSSQELILKVDQPTWNHNGGCLKFGPDGYLYIALGDGGFGNDPQNNSQNKNTLLGKMLRLDIDNGLPYSIPSDNPFVNDPEVLDEIWALGLRNPWRFSFDSETGDMWIGDVGQDAAEEIDFQSAVSLGGENYGWRCFEGTEFNNNSSQVDCEEDFIDPVFEIEHFPSGPCSITGGFVYRGSIFPDLFGKYIFADYCSGDFYVISQDENGNFTGNQVAQFNNDVATFGVDVEGELYMSSFSSGTIYKVRGQTVSSKDIIPAITSMNVIPNPVVGITELVLQTERSLELEINLVDITGKQIFKEKVPVDGEYRRNIDMQTLATGTYILNINTDDGLITKKIIKQ